MAPRTESVMLTGIGIIGSDVSTMLGSQIVPRLVCLANGNAVH